jgi:hypothetical protein
MIRGGFAYQPEITCLGNHEKRIPAFRGYPSLDFLKAYRLL